VTTVTAWSADSPPPLPEGEATRAELPFDIIDDLVRRSGWRAWAACWSKVCSRYRRENWLWECLSSGEDVAVVVPDDAPSINIAIARASEKRGGSRARPLVLVRPGSYREAVRITADVSICGLGTSGSAIITAPGWEPALSWGGFKVAATQASRSFQLEASSAGAWSEVCGLALVQRNQSQQVAVYCTFGAPSLVACIIHGSVHVAGEAARPSFHRCTIQQSRSHGMSFVDRAQGVVQSCRILGNRLMAIRVSANAGPRITDSVLMDNGVDAVSCLPVCAVEDEDDVDFDEFED
jgi:hypothetical protein